MLRQEPALLLAPLTLQMALRGRLEDHRQTILQQHLQACWDSETKELRLPWILKWQTPLQPVQHQVGKKSSRDCSQGNLRNQDQTSPVQFEQLH
jgi:hypothetical protein